MSVFDRNEEAIVENNDVQRESLMHFHVRMGHLSYDAIEQLAKDPSYGIQLTDTRKAV